jgi:hypothetical protein
MPMKKGYGKQAIAENIRLLIREGRPPKQAAAIAYEKAREERRKQSDFQTTGKPVWKSCHPAA